MAFATIDKPSKYFDVKLRQGFGSSGGTVTGLSFKPEMFWEKNRTSTTGSGTYVYDVVRGVYKFIRTNLTDAEATNTGTVTAFNSDGFTVGSADYATDQSLVAWCWSAGNSTGVSNTSGTITSTVSASTVSGFSIVSYTGNGTASATVGHGLGVTPKMIIVKNRSTSATWMVGHSSLTWASQYMQMSDTSAVHNDGATYGFKATPTSTVFQWSSGDVANNGSGSTYIAYCFAEVKGFSKFGSYTGNGSTDGPFVYTGFKPAFVMIKNSTFASQSWWISDNKRTPYNVASTTGNFLAANISDAEVTSGNTVDFLSNGFKIRTAYDGTNNSGSTPIYMAFAENPFCSSKGIPTTAR
jgi:hypothetical protein